MAGLVETCFNKAGSNPDRFADCLSNGQKKTGELNEAFQFKMVFLTRSVQNCIQNKQSVEKCSEEASKLGKDIVENLIKQIERI